MTANVLGNDNNVNNGDIWPATGSNVTSATARIEDHGTTNTGSGDIITGNEGPVIKTTSTPAAAAQPAAAADGGGILSVAAATAATRRRRWRRHRHHADTTTTTTDTDGGDVTTVDTDGGDISGGIDAEPRRQLGDDSRQHRARTLGARQLTNDNSVDDTDNS